MAKGLTIPLSLDTSSFDKQLAKSSLAIKNIAKNLDQFSTKKVNNDPNMLGKVYDTAERKVKKLAGSMTIVKDQANALLKISQAYNLSTAAGRKEFTATYNNYAKLKNLESSRLTSFNKIYNLQKEYTKLTGQQYKIRNSSQGYKDIQNLEKEVIALREKDKLTRQINERYSKFTNIAKLAASYFSLQQIGQFFKRVADVGGELQKQRVAIAGIVQDMSKANILFSQLKEQALESPFTFKHLIDGTRQLAAYNIETEKLYDTQFMLSELSAGLGVEMNRLVLAYGQVKAATVLRGQEMRQFTEAGIPIIQALADRFSELEGRVVSTSEVFERVSKRMVSFKMVDQVMRKMTEEGGKFYKMQEKQAETIYGQITNIRDAMEIMMLDVADQNEGVFLQAIKGIRLLIENWKILEHAIKAGAVVMIAYYTAKLGFHNVLFRNYPKILAHMWGEETATRANIKATKALAAARTIAMNIAIGAAVLLLSYTYEQIAAEGRYRKKIEETSDRNKDDYDSQLRQLKELIGRLATVTVGSREFLEIKDKLNAQYGQYLPRLINESDGVKSISDMYATAAKNMQNFYAMKARDESVAGIGSEKPFTKVLNKAENDIGSVLYNAGNVFTKKTSKSFAKTFAAELATAVKTGESMDSVIDAFKKKIVDAGGTISTTLESFIRSSALNVYDAYDDIISKIDTSVAETFSLSSVKVAMNLQALKREHREAIKDIREDYSLLEFQKELKIAALPNESQLGIIASSMKGSAKEAFNLFQNQGSYPNIKRNADSMTVTQQAVSKYFSKMAEGMSNEVSNSKVFNETKRKEIEIRNEAADAAYSELSSLISLTDATEKYQAVVDLEKQIERDEAALAAQKNLTAGTFAYAEAVRQLSVDKAKLSIFKGFFPTIGITGDGNGNGPKAQNPEIDRANRLVTLYREMYETYKKYSQFVTKEEARRLTSAEFTDVYGELNKEMGGKLGPMSIIEDQTGLVQLLDKAVTGALIRTKDGVKVIKRALTSELGGQQLQNKQDSMESLQKQIEEALSGLMVEAPDSAAISLVESLMVKMGSEFGAKGGELAAQFTSQLDKFKIDSALASLDRQMESLTVKRDLGRELSDIKSETGIDLSSVLSDRIVTHTEYLTQLEELKNKYLLLGNDGTKKAADIDIQIEKGKYDKLKMYITETAKMQAQLYTTQERRDAITLNISSLKEQIEAAKKELEGATDELQKKNLNALIDWLDMQAKLKQRELDSTEETLFQESEIYKKLYGDITEYSEKAYRDMLQSMEDAMRGAKDIQDGDKEKKRFTYTFTDKDNVKQTQEIVISATKYQTILNKINREQGKLSKNPFKEILKDFKGFIGKGPDGKTSVDFSSLGDGLEGISSIMGQLEPIGEILGLGGADMAGFNAITQGVGALARIAANPADVGAYVELLQSYVGIMDWDNSKKIENAANQIEKLQISYEGLMSAFEDSVGFEDANAAFKNLSDNLQRQGDLYAEMARQEKDKKMTDKEALKEYEKASNEAYQKRQDLIKQQIAEWSTTVKSAAEQFTDAWVTAFQETGDGLSALDKTFEQVMLGIIKKQIQAKWMEKIVEPFVTQLNRAVDPDGELGFGISDAEARAIQTSYKQVKFGAQEADDAMQAMLKLFGLDGKGDSQYDTLQKGIQGITEDSAQIIASYMNSVRLEVLTIRQILESRYSGPQNASTNSIDSMLAIQSIMNEFYPQYLNNLIAIKENTNFLKDAYDPSRRGFRVS